MWGYRVLDLELGCLDLFAVLLFCCFVCDDYSVHIGLTRRATMLDI